MIMIKDSMGFFKAFPYRPTICFTQWDQIVEQGIAKRNIKKKTIKLVDKKNHYNFSIYLYLFFLLKIIIFSGGTIFVWKLLEIHWNKHGLEWLRWLSRSDANPNNNIITTESIFRLFFSLTVELIWSTHLILTQTAHPSLQTNQPYPHQVRVVIRAGLPISFRNISKVPPTPNRNKATSKIVVMYHAKIKAAKPPRRSL